ncbi:MAG: hypothetical protein ACKV2U_06630, partial [Bryobacteraceae bacterium]
KHMHIFHVAYSRVERKIYGIFYSPETTDDALLSFKNAKVGLAKGANALLLFGGGHLYRHWWNPFGNARGAPLNLIDLLEGSSGPRAFVVMVHAFVEPDPELEQRLHNWNRPSFATLGDTWLGNWKTEPLLSDTVERGFPDGRVAKTRINGYAGLTLADLADGYL